MPGLILPKHKVATQRIPEYDVDEVQLREPRLMVPGKAPVVAVKPSKLFWSLAGDSAATLALHGVSSGILELTTGITVKPTYGRRIIHKPGFGWHYDTSQNSYDQLWQSNRGKTSGEYTAIAQFGAARAYAATGATLVRMYDDNGGFSFSIASKDAYNPSTPNNLYFNIYHRWVNGWSTSGSFGQSQVWNNNDPPELAKVYTAGVTGAADSTLDIITNTGFSESLSVGSIITPPPSVGAGVYSGGAVYAILFISCGFYRKISKSTLADIVNNVYSLVDLV